MLSHYKNRIIVRVLKDFYYWILSDQKSGRSAKADLYHRILISSTHKNIIEKRPQARNIIFLMRVCEHYENISQKSRLWIRNLSLKGAINTLAIGKM